jgi:hypothetical protein
MSDGQRNIVVTGSGTISWPPFPVEAWAQTGPTLHRWTQVVGKIRMALTPPQNHYWHVPLYISERGFATSPIPYGSELLAMEFDFVRHELALTTSWGPTHVMPLYARSVADFHAELMAALHSLNIDVHIWTTPVEIADRTPFEQDLHHASYDPAAAHAVWRALVQADRVFKVFRGQYLGKCSPVHFFWGAFDLAVTRFSGRHAGLYRGSAPNVSVHVMHESYSHEVSSAGFWPGDERTGPAFYSYAVPQPAGFQAAVVTPAEATYDPQLGEFLLPYATVQASADADAMLLGFLQTTYAAAADLGHWDRTLLESAPPCACTARTLAKPHS